MPTMKRHTNIRPLSRHLASDREPLSRKEGRREFRNFSHCKKEEKENRKGKTTEECPADRQLCTKVPKQAGSAPFFPSIRIPNRAGLDFANYTRQEKKAVSRSCVQKNLPPLLTQGPSPVHFSSLSLKISKGVGVAPAGVRPTVRRFI